MPTETGISRTLESFCDSLDEGPSVLIGTSRLGKSSALDEHEEIHLIDSLPELHELNGGDDTYPVIDHLYRVIVEYNQSGTTEHQETLEAILDTGSTEDGTPVGAVMRPWSYQYLCSVSESQFGSAISNWNRHYATISKEDAIRIGTQLTELDQSTVDEYIAEIYFEFDIDTDAVSYSYETYIPHLLLDLTHDDDEYLPPGVVSTSSSSTSTQLAGTIRDFGRDLFKAASLSNIQSTSEQAFRKLKSIDSDSVRQLISEVDQDTLPGDIKEHLSRLDVTDITEPILKTVGNAVPGAYPVLVLVLYYTSQEDEQIAAFEEFQQRSQLLFGDGVPTPTKELIEVNLQLEPYTLESANQLASEETFAKLRMLQTGLQNTREDQEALSQEIKDIAADFDTLEEQLNAFEADLTELRHRFSELEAYLSDNTVSHPEIVDTKFELSLLGIDRLEEQLLQQEERYLNIPDGTSLALAYLPRDRTAQQETKSHLEDNQIVIVRGAIGAGKTTTAYHTLAALERAGGFVGLPNFEKSDYAYIRHALQRVEDQSRYLFVSYRLGFPAVDTPTQLRNLLELVNDGLCNKLIIECRDEVYQDLLNHGGDAVQGHQGLPSIWRSQETIECREIDHDIADDVISWIYTQHNIDDAAIGDEVLTTNRLVEKFGHNPEFLKIAARLSAEGASVDDVETIGELIELDIRSLLSNFEKERERYRDFIELLALTRGISIDRAMTVIGESIRHADVVELTEALQGYVKFPEEDLRHSPATLTPDIYTDLLFQHWHVEENSSSLLVANVRDLLEEGYDDLIPDVLLNLSLAYTRADDDSTHREKIQTATGDSLRHLSEQGSSDSYLQAVSNLGSIPVRADTIAWAQIEPTLTQTFLENMWKYRVYSEMVVGSMRDEEYDETLDLTISFGRLLASQMRAFGSDEAEQIFANMKSRLCYAEESYQWSGDAMANLPADLLTYMLMEAARNAIQNTNGTTVPPELDQIFGFFDELNRDHAVHAEAAGQLFAVPFVGLEDPKHPDELHDQLTGTFSEVSPYLHKTADRSNLFEPKRRSDWSSPSSVFLRRFHLEISLLTGLEEQLEVFEKWMTFIWESVEETIEYCDAPSLSIFATVRTIILGAAVRQEIVLGGDSDIISTCSQTMIAEITPRQLPPSDFLLSQYFTDHPESWYARLLELAVENVISQEQNEAFGDDLMYRIAGEEEPDREELVRIVTVITNQIHLINQEVEDKDRFEREVCYAWYRGLVLNEEPSQSSPYLQCVENQSDILLDYDEKKYLCLWTVTADDVQDAAGSMTDPYASLPIEERINKTIPELLSWLEVFLQDADALLAASRFSQEHSDEAVEDVERLLTEIVGILNFASSTTRTAHNGTEGFFRELYTTSEPVLQNIKTFVKKSDIYDELSDDMRYSLKFASTY